MAGTAVGIATAILVLIQGWLLSRVVVGLIDDVGHPWVVPTLLVVGVFAIRGGLAWLNQVLAHRSAAAVKSQLRRDLLRARADQPSAPTSTAELVTLVTQGLDALDGYFSKFLPQLALAATVPVIVGAVVFWADWPSGVILLVTLPLIPIFMALIGWQTQERVNARWATQRRLARHFADLVAGLGTLQVFGRATAQAKGLAETEDRHRRATMTTLVWSFLSSFALELLATLSVALIAVGIGLRVVHGDMDFLTGLFVLIIAPEAYLPVRMVGVHYHDSADGVAAADSAFALIDAAPTTRGTAVPQTQASLTLDGVQHTYPGTDGPTAAPCTLVVAPGEIVALAGPSGVGKSTIVNAVMGFLDPSDGRIAWGETDVSQLDPDAWRARVAHVAQLPGMVSGTVADNVALATPDLPQGRLRAVLDRTGAADVALDRDVGDDGEGLSAGERRRVAFARALLAIEAGATLMVVDEPTAGLDAGTEETVIAALREAGVGALVVSHRPAVLDACDRVVQMTAAPAPAAAEAER